MAQTPCKYHPLIPARWVCDSCEINFCGDCVTRNSARNTVSCPLCKKSLRQADASNYIVPFWNRTPKLFMYPLNPTSLLMITIISVASYMCLLSGRIGMIGLILVFSMYLRYAMAVLNETATGNLKPVNFDADLFTYGALLPLKQLAVFVGMVYSLIWLFRNGHWSEANYLGYIYLFILPAQIMLLTLEQNLTKSLMPMQIIDLISRLIGPYLIMIAYIYFTYISLNYVVSSLFFSSSIISRILVVGSFYYFLTMIFHMMGYVIYQYHEELDFEVYMHVDEELESHTQHKSDAQNPEIAGIEVFLKEGRNDEARNHLKELVVKEPMNLEYSQLYYQLIMSSSDSDAWAKHADHYINLLCFKARYADAVRVYREIEEQFPGFKMSNPDVYKDMLRLLRSQMAFKECVLLSSNFHKRYPEHESIPDVYFMVAQILTENFNQKEQALKLLMYIKSQYPDHVLSSDISTYLTVMSQGS